MILARGDKQLVVQETLMTIFSELSYLWFYHKHGALAERAEMLTLWPLQVVLAFSIVVKTPAPTTFLAPAPSYLMLAESHSWKMEMAFPSMTSLNCTIEFGAGRVIPEHVTM